MSMQIGSSPQLTPSVIVESPRSPPRGYFFNRGLSRSPERAQNDIGLNKVQALVSQASSRSSTRPGTPRSESGDKPAVEAARVTRALNEHSKALNESTKSLPPAVSRSEKPKIPAKPAPLTAQELSSRLPEERKFSADRRVSPFSTPPSSEGSPSPHASPDRAAVHRHTQGANALPAKENGHSGLADVKIPAQTMSTSKDPRMMGFGPTKTIAERRDPRTLGFAPTMTKQESKADTTVPARANTVSEGSKARDIRDAGFATPRHTQRHVSESLRPLPPPTYSDLSILPRVALQRDARQFGFSSPAQPVLTGEENRPGLPPRRGVAEPPPRPSEESKRGPNLQHPHLPPTATAGRTFGAVQAPLASASKVIPATNTHFPPPPKRNTLPELEPLPQDRNIPTSAVTRPMPSTERSRQLPNHLVAEDSDEAESTIDEPVGTRTDYPDTSQANRRPPFFREGLQDLPIRSDARNFDVCGQWLCTTGYTTRVFDLSTGEKSMEYNHGETVKVISVAFRHEQDFKSEGSRIWIGNNIGELHEIDVATHTLVASSSVHNRREVVRILRHQKDLWTLDDEGKLFVWQALESGSPSLKYSHQAHRVPKGHTFSMVVRDKLWLALGREIRVYRPGSESKFPVLDAPLHQPGVGDVTSGTYTSQAGGRAYFGHTDGKVTVYSTKDFSCLGNIKVSDYKINSLAFVGDWLWAGYKTGKIYVYDTSSKPWKVKKDWRAHDGPVAGLVLDPSSIWTLNRLQVTSIGHDQSARLWDGMLEDDWIENTMHESDIDYCTFREIKASVLTWNVGASNPLDVRCDFICDAIHPEDPPELLVFGFQEVVDLEDRAVTAKSILGFGKKKDTSRTDPHVGRVYREWRDYLAKCISRYMGSSVSYSELHTSSLIGLFQCVFVRQDVRNQISGLSAIDVKCGMKGHYGNKVCFLFSLDKVELILYRALLLHALLSMIVHCVSSIAT